MINYLRWALDKEYYFILTKAVFIQHIHGGTGLLKMALFRVCLVEGVVGIMRAWNTFLGRSRLKAATMTYCVQTRFCRTPPAILRAIAPFAMQKAGSVGYADTTCTSVAKYNETKALIVDFIEYYNNERISASLGWKTPAQAVA